MAQEAFEIFELSGYTNGQLAICRQPNYEADYQTIDQWAPFIVVTLTTEAEFPKIGPFLPQYFLEAPYDWLHIPITDFGIPNTKDQAIWQDALKQLSGILENNGRILIHCKGGQGRSGMLLLKLLTLQGEDGETAFKRIRDIRPKAVETDPQYIWATKAL